MTAAPTPENDTADDTAASDTRAMAVVAGAAQFSTLDDNERTRAHHLINERISQQAAAVRFVPR